MKKTAIALFIGLIFLITIELQTANIAKANPFPSQLIISIDSPTNKTYDSNTLVLNVSVRTKFDNLTATRTINYSLDGKAEVSLSGLDYNYDHNKQASIVVGSTTLSGLDEGPHTIAVLAEYDYKVYTYPDEPRPDDSYVIQTHKSKANIWFTVDTTPPSISNLSFEDKTYYSSELPLSFSINETVSQISYSLDNHANVTINGNTTLTGLIEGPHNLAVYANDTVGNMGATETIYFDVAKPEPFPTLIVTVASGASVVLITAGLIFYQRKRSRRN